MSQACLYSLNNVREVGDAPLLQGRQGRHSPTLGSPSLTPCTFTGHLGFIWTQKEDRQHSWSRTHGQPWVTPSGGVHYPGGKPHVLPAQKGAQEEGHSQSCLPGPSPWVTAKLPTLLSACEPCQALAELSQPFVASLKHSSDRTHWSPTGHSLVTQQSPTTCCGCRARDLTNLTFPISNVCPIFTASRVPASAFIPPL